MNLIQKRLGGKFEITNHYYLV